MEAPSSHSLVTFAARKAERHGDTQLALPRPACRPRILLLPNPARSTQPPKRSGGRRANVRMASVNYLLAGALSCALLTACGTPTGPTKPISRLPAGKWGGPQVEITITDGGFEFTSSACVRGHFAAPLVQGDGTFSVEGTLEPMAGPPPPPPWPHGRITGKLRETSLAFSATYDNGAVLGPLTATLGQSSSGIFPCPV